MFNTFPNTTFRDHPKLKEAAYDNSNVAINMAIKGSSDTDCIDNTVEQERQIVAKYARLTPSYNHPRNFIAIASIVLEICT